MTQTLVIVNPASSGGATGRHWPALADRLEAAIGPFDVAMTDAPGSATALARAALKGGTTRLIAVGGDGTVGEIVNGFFDQDALINPEAALGLIDAGTGSDFRRNLGFPADQDQQIDILKRGQTKPMTIGHADYQTINGEAASRYFTVLCGFGVSPAVNEYVNQSPRLKRYGAAAAFAMAALHMIVTFRNPSVQVQVDGKEVLSGPSLLGATCNGQWVGGGMKMAPDGDMFAPELDFILGGDIRFWQRLRLFSGIYGGRHIGSRNVYALKGQSLRAEALNGAEVLVDMDGDVIGTLPLTIRALPNAIKVIC